MPIDRKVKTKRANSEKAESPDYEIGYGRPPKRTQFKKGQRQRSGRKKGTRNLLTAFREAVQKRVIIRIGDETCRVKLGEAIILANFRMAVAGNPVAQQNIARLAEKLGHVRDLTDRKQAGGFIVVPEPMSEEEWVKRAMAAKSPTMEDYYARLIKDDESGG